MLPPLHYCFLLLHAQGSCYFESRCKEQKEQLAEPAGAKPVQLPDLLVFVRKEGKGGGSENAAMNGEKKQDKFEAAVSITREKFCQADKFRNDIEIFLLSQVRYCCVVSNTHRHLLPPSSISLSLCLL